MKSQISLALFTCVASALAANTKWNVEHDFKWGFNCDFQGFVLSSAPMERTLCTSNCSLNLACHHFAWIDGTCILKNGCAREGDETVVAGTGNLCGYSVSRNQCNSTTKIAIISASVPTSLLIVVVVIVVAKFKKMCCFQPRPQDPKPEAVKSISNSSGSTLPNNYKSYRPQHVQVQPEEEVYDEIDYSIFDLPKPINGAPEMHQQAPRPPQFIPNFWEISL